LKPPSRRALSISWRIALLSWLVTSLTLVVFVVIIIPEQKKTYLENLESKARGISASLQEVTAGAVVSADYGAVVEHCKQVLQGDRSIEYLIITKADDGFSLINKAGAPTETPSGSVVVKDPQWSQENLDGYWRPALRAVRSGIDRVPIFEREIFSYARPFDYSGIEWGWIHVGLSLNAYNESIIGVYRRTTLLAVICLFFSLGASVVYARRLVRPVLDLQRVVQQVAGGDLSARAKQGGGDELGALAGSVNVMTEALLRRDRILQSVRFSAQQFLSNPRWSDAIAEILSKLGQAADASRSYLFQNELDRDGRLLMYQRHEWAAPGVTAEIANPTLQGLPYLGSGFDEWAEVLARGEIIAGTVASMSEGQRSVLQPQGIRSIITIPIMVEGVWWGFLGLDDCVQERTWTEAERDSLRTAADMLGAAIARQRAQDGLLEAKATLEMRVAERTRELSEQVKAKDQALSDLAEAQSSLVEMSRKSGMAEVATGVLHNVGNVLNSVNVSCTLAVNRLQRSSLGRVSEVAALMAAPQCGLAQFLTADPKGRQIPDYLATLGKALDEDRAVLIEEVESLRERIDHIKDIVAMQQSYGRVSGVTDTLHPSVLVDDALKLNVDAIVRHHIKLRREFQEVPDISVDKHKVLQILLNLIRNAKHALQESAAEPKVMTLRLLASRPGFIAIQVQDNGVGIAAENLTRIFRHGFTTRADGHGFGLHSGALAAKELGGSLVAESAGLGQGACFTLELPLVTKVG
jgi:two-component system NtrC family sensor kinase